MLLPLMGPYSGVAPRPATPLDAASATACTGAETVHAPFGGCPRSSTPCSSESNELWTKAKQHQATNIQLLATVKQMCHRMAIQWCIISTRRCGVPGLQGGYAARQGLVGVHGGPVLPGGDGLQAAWKGGGWRLPPPQQHRWLVSCNAAAVTVGNEIWTWLLTNT